MTKDFDKAMCRAVRERIVALTKEAIKAEFGYDVNAAGGSYSTNVFNMKIDIGKPLDVITAPLVCADALKFGLAPRGTKVTYGNKEYTVIKARRAKYLVEQTGTGINYVIPFEAVNLSFSS